MSMIDWIEEGTQKDAIAIIVGFNKLFRNEYPIYAYSQKELNNIVNYLNNNDDDQVCRIIVDLTSVKYRKS